ncbi:growth-regulating factor 3-like protein [Trifolium pratense]|uniref:Growth-regulating factor n=2 Tax=Trifolium pratense TaxID=57577 RepID=A0A2K3N0L4_TRIPR|nr:growth-regulating factor 4-like [Trifolium pratense]XP_045813887.1 growth-regulating factor 4-like [Trifolium pratense]PNX92734.1 growth-regulating factor 3-like protein [Trifolium pratense]PNX96546.1 growth-regulating factor 3-like protein [Trifolium pratense]CAJ2647036.1 unnamed protein product [Trifolium pratense]
MSVQPPPQLMWPPSNHPPFTVSQWQELEHQALIFKYLKAGVSVPPDLLLPIRKSLQLMSHPSLGYYGKKIDPEPGRCRRTDGKKWRCAKDAHPDSKYCDRHMIRRRYRSRKPVESSSCSSQSSSVTVSSTSQQIGSSIGTASATVTASAAVTAASTFHTLPLHTNGTREGLAFTLGNTIPHMDPMLLSHQGSKKSYRFGLNTEAEEHDLVQKDFGTVKYQGYDFTSDDTWYNNMSQIPSNNVSESRTGSTMVNKGNYFQQQRAREPEQLFNLDTARSKEIVFNSQLGNFKQEYQSSQSLFSDWQWKKDLASSGMEYKPSKDFNTNPDINAD